MFVCVYVRVCEWMCVQRRQMQREQKGNRVGVLLSHALATYSCCVADYAFLLGWSEVVPGVGVYGHFADGGVGVRIHPQLVVYAVLRGEVGFGGCAEERRLKVGCCMGRRALVQ